MDIIFFSFLGIGLHYDDDLVLDESNWRGKNLLGKALMEVRDNFDNTSKKYEIITSQRGIPFMIGYK